MRWAMILLCSVVLTLGMSTAQGRAEGLGSISGMVVDESGAAIEGARITVVLEGSARATTLTRSDDSFAIASTTSNPDGHFLVSQIPFGHYVLQVESGNFQTERVDVFVSPTAASGESLLIKMRIASVRESVNVTATIGDRLTGYTAETATTAIKTDTPILETPLAIQVVTRETLDDRQTFNIVTAATENASSVFNTPQYYDDIIVRGFDASATTYRNGLIVQAVTDQETANVQSIEILKGPAAVLYGRMEPGGVVNIVTKRPLPETYYSLQEEAGSFNQTRTSIDATGPLMTDKLGYRLNVAYLSEDSFRDYIGTRNAFFAATISYHPSERFRLNVEGEYQNTRFNDDENGIPAIGRRPANIPISRYLGEPSLPRNWQSRPFVGYDWVFDIAKHWSLINRASYNPVHYFQRGAIIGSISEQTGDAQRYLWNADMYRHTASTNLDLTGRITTGPFEHSILLGIDHRYYYQRGMGLSGYTIADINIYDPVYSGLGISGPITIRGYSTDGEGWTGLYLQDMVSFAGGHLHVLFGGRYDWAQIGFGSGPNSYAEANGPHNAATGVGFQNSHDRSFSPRIGLVYQPRPWLSLYGNYTKSFGFTGGLPLPGQPPFPPEIGKQYEAGVKAEFLRKRLAASAAFYNITKSNILDTLPGGLYAVPIGLVRSRGVEADVTGRINANWSLVANYSHDDALIVKGVTNALFESSGPPGNRLASVPPNAANLWLRYDFANRVKGLRMGAGGSLAGQRQGDNENDFQLPGYGRVDAMVGYQFAPSFLHRGKTLSFQLNVRNLLNKSYFESGSGFGTYSADPTQNTRVAQGFPGATRNFLVSTRLEF
jgi:iron complex outermembrane receptor protein